MLSPSRANRYGPRMRSRLTLVVCLLTAVAAATGCGSSGNGKAKVAQPPKQVALSVAKPKVVEHGGLAYGAFKQDIVAPFTSRSLSESKASQAKMKAAIVYLIDQLGQMKVAALTNDTLRPISVDIDNLAPRVGTFAARVATGKANNADLAAVTKQMNAVLATAAKVGAPIPKDKAPAISGG